MNANATTEEKTMKTYQITDSASNDYNYGEWNGNSERHAINRMLAESGDDPDDPKWAGLVAKEVEPVSMSYSQYWLGLFGPVSAADIACEHPLRAGQSREAWLLAAELEEFGHEAPEDLRCRAAQDIENPHFPS
jgi:hypothetical protein